MALEHGLGKVPASLEALVLVRRVGLEYNQTGTNSFVRGHVVAKGWECKGAWPCCFSELQLLWIFNPVH